MSLNYSAKIAKIKLNLAKSIEFIIFVNFVDESNHCHRLRK